ncbi:cytochrome c oxidase subunit 3 [Halosimplex salinum]|uniref:cytochrome c oxidase subunit 3 n=1 Tax=Halosimplex salinum TaxID=1710538 RepID=UPI000F468047|nr:heme-copper oxidase subunit III [Halosimplex salinum]
MADSVEASDAVHDRDEHHERSRWPVIGAAGAAALYVGVALVFVSESVPMVPTALGLAVAVAGTVGLVVGLLGWTDEAFLDGYLARGVTDYPTDDANRIKYRATMVVFLATDLATFAAGFVYYFFVRAGTWPPAELPHLLTSLVAVNTLVLLASSVTLHYAHHALHEGERRRFETLLGVTLLAGVLFVAGQAYEYFTFVVEEGFTLTDGVFASAFYGLTGLHGLHVSLGVVLLGLLAVRARRGHFGPERDTAVVTVSLYWHFVDAVWVFLVVVLYVGASV